MKFKAIFITSDEILKGLAIAVTLYGCFAITAGSGACLNPWFGLAQNAYDTGLANGFGYMGSYFSVAIWVYILAPFIGAILAALFLRLQSAMDRTKRHEESPPKVIESREVVREVRPEYAPAEVVTRVETTEVRQP